MNKRKFVVEDFIYKLYGYCEIINITNKGEGVALNLLLRTFDELIMNNQYSVIDEIIEKFDLTKASRTLIYGFLATTLSIKDKLNNRCSLIERAEKELLRRGDTRDMLNKIFVSYV